MRDPTEILPMMRSLYQGTLGSIVVCAAVTKPASWESMRIRISSMYSRLIGSVFES